MTYYRNAYNNRNDHNNNNRIENYSGPTEKLGRCGTCGSAAGTPCRTVTLGRTMTGMIHANGNRLSTLENGGA